MLNEHVGEYLEEYRKTPKPTYAVLISGAWGSGKTYIVNKFMETVTSNRVLYVTVNGVSTETELQTRFVYAAYPALTSKKLRTLGSLAKSALGIIRFKSDLTLDQILDYDQFDTFIIDDIERSRIPLPTLFGFINGLIEHDKKHVIILGNEAELVDQDVSYKRTKEKLVGFTLGVLPDVDSVLSKIQAEAGRTLASVVRNKRFHIEQVFNLTQSQNLRVLEQVLYEYVQTADFLNDHTNLSESYENEVLRLFIAINMSYKLGYITRSDISNRKTDAFALAFSEEKERESHNAMRQLSDRLKDVDVYSGVLDNDYLESKICDGLHRAEYIARSVGDAAAQADPDANPEWRNVWYYMRNDDSTTEASFSRMLIKFRHREYHDVGVILHIFGLLLEMRRVGLLGWTDAQVEKEGRKYIDDLAKSGLLPVFGDDFLTGFRHGAAHGLGFTRSDNPTFSKLWNYYRSKSDDLKERRLVEGAMQAAAQISVDHQIFVKAVIPGESGQDMYSTPVLHHLDVREFANAFMGCNAAAQFEIMSSLGSRYESSPYANVLKTERAWVKKLRSAIRGRLRGERKLTRIRIERLMEWNLDKHLAEVERPVPGTEECS
jgi:nucleoside-triphosphatase THEP1